MPAGRASHAHSQSVWLQRQSLSLPFILARSNSTRLADKALWIPPVRHWMYASDQPQYSSLRPAMPPRALPLERLLVLVELEDELELGADEPYEAPLGAAASLEPGDGADADSAPSVEAA